MTNLKDSEKPLRILVITSTYARSENDFAVPWMRETHRRLKEKGHQVTVLAPSFKGLASHILDGIEIVRFRYAPSFIEDLTHEEGASYKVRRRWKQLLAVPYIFFGCLMACWLAMTRRFDVIHVHWPFPHGILGSVASLVSRAPVVAMCHGAELSLAKRKTWIKPILRFALRSASVRIANSSSTAAEVEALCSKGCVVVPYGTTVKSATTIAPTNKKPRVLFTGRLIERKGLEFLLRAAPSVLQNHDVEFIITGNGTERIRLEKLRDELGLNESVKFLGFVSNEELKLEYASCDIWVNPGIIDSWGDAEGLGVGSIEAYNYLKPVIASAVGGIPDTVIDGVTGYLVPEKDVLSLSSAICDLLNHPEKAKNFGINGYRFAKQTFSWSQIIPRIESLYRNAASHSDKGLTQDSIAA